MAAAGFVNAPAERRVHLDFHTPDFVPNVGEQFDAERLADALATGDVEQAAFFAKCHYGNAYYPTKVGRAHPGLQCDMLGRFVAAAVERGVRTFAYYSLGFDVWYGTEHPDNMQQPQPFFERRCGPWTPVCVNGPYGEYAREQLAEIVRAYDVAGVWLDIVGYYAVCVCPRCRDAYQRDTGRALPFDDDKPEAGIGADYYMWQRRMLDEYTGGLAELLAELRPGCELLCNTATGIHEKAAGLTNQRDGQWCEEAVGNRPHTLTAMSLCSSLFDNAAQPRPFEIVTQRFHMGWGDWTLRPLEGLKYDVATILAHGGLPSIGDQLYGDGRFEAPVYDRIGEAYRWLKPRQGFCGTTRSAAEVGVFATSSEHASDPGGIKYRGDACLNAEGLFKAMMDAHCPVAALADLGVLAGGRYAVLLTDENLPDADESVAALNAYVESGGHVLAVGVGPERYWPLLGVSEARPLPTPVSYIRMADAPPGDLSVPVLARVQGHGVTLQAGAEVLGCWTHPLSGKSEGDFYSHQHGPPGPATEEPAVWRVTRDAGSVIGIAAPIAAAYWHTSYSPLRMIIMACVDRLLDGRRQVYVEGLPAIAEVALRTSGEAVFVHVVVPSVSRPGIREGGETFFMDEAVSIHDVTIALRLPEGRACTVADQLGHALAVTPDERDGYVRVILAPFQTHTAVRFDLR